MEVKPTNAGLPSVFIHPSSLGGNCKHTLLSSHRKRRYYSFIFLLGNFGFVNFLRGLLQEYLYYTMQLIFLLPFGRKIQTECEFSKPTEQQQFVRGRGVPAKDVRTVCTRS